MTNTSTFHAGELAAQRRAGVGDVASRVAGFIRDHMPQQHRDFHTSLPFIVLSAADEEGQPWVTILEGEERFVTSPDAKTLIFDSLPDTRDPLAKAMSSGTDVGLLGIELATRRRNRLSGHIQADDDSLRVAVRQTFGNCPQYIREREWHRAADNAPGETRVSTSLSPDQMKRIGQADTMFIGTGQQGEPGAPSNGYDASHRGGEPGFVQVVDEAHLRIPDYAGNNFFNTIGNILQNPKVGLLFIDFATGGMLHVSGSAQVEWEPKDTLDPAVRRMIDVAIEAVVDRPGALSLRWQSEETKRRPFLLTGKVAETSEITSFYLVPANHTQREDFEAGQHLPVELDVPNQRGKVRRSYSLSGSPRDDSFRLSVKREPHGIASRHLHDALHVGDVIEAGRPSGDFGIPCGACPLVLVSAGVGITPMLSMLHAAARNPDERPVWFVHGARDSDHHAFRREVDSLVASSRNIHSVIHYSQPLKFDLQGSQFDATGRITPDSLMALQAGPDAHYMLCGPTEFMSEIRSGLEARGVPGNQVHFETFGPSA